MAHNSYLFGDATAPSAGKFSGMQAFNAYLTPAQRCTAMMAGRTTNLTADYSPSGIQLTPGQWLDRANNKHAVLPTNLRQDQLKTSGVLRGVNTWAAATTIQHIVGVDAPAVPANSAIRLRARATVSGTFNIGDGVDVERYGAGVTIDTGWTDIALLTSFPDGTNRDLTLTPTASYSGTVTSSVTVEALT